MASILDELIEMPEKFPRKIQVNIEIGHLNRGTCQRLAASWGCFLKAAWNISTNYKQARRVSVPGSVLGSWPSHLALVLTYEAYWRCCLGHWVHGVKEKIFPPHHCPLKLPFRVTSQ